MKIGSVGKVGENLFYLSNPNVNSNSEESLSATNLLIEKINAVLVLLRIFVFDLLKQSLWFYTIFRANFPEKAWQSISLKFQPDHHSNLPISRW